MQQPFLNFSTSTWNVLFLVVRYVLVALLLAYLTKVFVKRKDVVTDIKGSVLEWQVETYKNIHRWVMGMKCVTAPSGQQENRFRGLLSSRRCKSCNTCTSRTIISLRSFLNCIVCPTKMTENYGARSSRHSFTAHDLSESV